MAEVTLNDANIGSLVDQGVPARVPQHVRVDVQVLQAGRCGYLADQVPHRDAGERLAPFADEQSVAVSRHIHLGPFDEPRLHRLALRAIAQTDYRYLEAVA